MPRIIPVHFEIEIPDDSAVHPWACSSLVIVNDETGERKTIISEGAKEGREWDLLTYRLEQGLKEVSLRYD
jgi:hypothetical protein